MKRSLSTSILAPGFVVLFLMAACTSPEQPSPKPDPEMTTCPIDSSLPMVPVMWVPQTISQTRESNYWPIANLLTNMINKEETDSLYYTAGEFTQMLDTFSKLPGTKEIYIYFGVFDAPGSAHLPSDTLSGRLTPIFGISSLNGMQYYYLPPNTVNFDAKQNALPSAVVTNWRTLYENTINNWLKPQLDYGDIANYPNEVMPADHSTVSDTRYMHYPLVNFLEMAETEVKYQNLPAHNEHIIGFEAYFSAFSFKPKPGKRDYSNRLLIQFEYAQDDGKGGHQTLFLDTTYKFCNRRPPDGNSASAAWRQVKLGVLLDNGQLCPPKCN